MSGSRVISGFYIHPGGQRFWNADEREVTFVVLHLRRPSWLSAMFSKARHLAPARLVEKEGVLWRVGSNSQKSGDALEPKVF